MEGNYNCYYYLKGVSTENQIMNPLLDTPKQLHE